MKRATLQRKTRLKPGTKLLKPGKPMAKGSGPVRKTRGVMGRKPETVKRRRERKAKRFGVQFHSDAFVEFVHSLGCCIPGCRREDIQAAHVGRTRGRGGQWWEVAPLCGAEYPGHHQEQEGRTPYMNERYGVDLELIASATAQRFLEKYGLRDSDEATATGREG